MEEPNLIDFYRAYIEALNERRWDALAHYVCDPVSYDGERIGLAAYKANLVENCRIIPDLFFRVEILVTDATRVAARLLFDCSPTGEFMGLAIDGRRVIFSENVFYEIEGGKIARVWSVIDKAAIEAQIGR